MNDFHISTYPLGPLATNTYLFSCVKTKEAAVIDPSWGSFDAVCEEINKGITLTKILLTHSHFDHIAEVSRFQQELSLPIYVHSLDAANVREPGSDGIVFPFLIHAAEPSVFLTEGNVITVGELTLEVLHTPGHSPGSLCYYCKTAQVLFSGDTLFRGTYGNTSFSTGEPNLMKGSLLKLCGLPLKTVVYPGHGGKTTLEKEASWIKTL